MSLTAGINTPTRAGELVAKLVATAIHLYPGQLIAENAAGYAVPAADAAALRIVGCSQDESDNSGGADGAISCRVARGVFRYANSVGDPVAQADIGNICFVEDDQTVNKAGGAHKVRAGRIVDIDSVGVWVDIRAQLQPVSYTQTSAAPSALTSAQNATTAAVDLATSEALANALKANYNQLQADVVALRATLGALVTDYTALLAKLS